MSTIGELFNKLHDFIVDKKYSIGYKLSYAILFFTLLLSVDLIFKPSLSLYQSNKLSKLEKIAVLKQEFKSEQETLSYLKNMQDNILSDTHYIEFIQSRWSSFLKSSQGDINKTTTNIDHINNPKLSIFYTALSSSTFFIVFILFMLFSPVMNKSYNVRSFAAAIIAASMGLIAAIILTSVLMLVPVIWKPFVNYLLYFVLQILIFYGITKIKFNN